MEKKSLFSKIIIFFTILLMLINVGISQTKSRNEIPEKYKWDLTPIYKSTKEWKADKVKLEKALTKLASFKGHLSDNSDILFQALTTFSDALKKFYLVSDYASRLRDQDLNISKNQKLALEADVLGTKFSEASSFLTPEILEIPSRTIKKFFSEKPELSTFKMFVENIQRLKAHTLSKKEEALLAMAGMLSGSQENVYSIFDNAEKPNAKVKLENGTEIELDASTYVRYRSTQNRKDRKKIFKALFENYGKFINTLGANFVGKLKTDWFFAKARKYSSALESSLNANNIPVSVYTNLLDQIHKNLPTLHRALKIKKKLLGINQLHYYDLYTPIVKKVDMKFSIEEGQKILTTVLKPLGKEYIKTVQRAFDERWIDYLPNVGKRSGAYSSGAAYDYHPYILLNWTGDYESVSTLAHEMGHTMHSYFSNKTQPFINSDYATFVAEIASTTNENILNHYMVQHAKNDEEKMYLLGSYLEMIRTTIFRQASFAEFELEVHSRIEKGEPMTGETISQIYYDIVKKYYGHDKGVCIVDPHIANEWAYIPHFLGYNYYVYQYSTSLIYATAFAEKIIKEGKPAVDKYFEILKGGASDYPINLIKKAGIDPLSSEAFDLTMAKMNRVMDMIEEIINKK